jgi:hypothetical protein
MVKVVFNSIFIVFFIWRLPTFGRQELIWPHGTSNKIMVWVTWTRFWPWILGVLRLTWVGQLVTKTNLPICLQSWLTLQQLTIAIGHVRFVNAVTNYRAWLCRLDLSYKEILDYHSVSLLLVHKVTLSISVIAVKRTYSICAIVVVFFLLLINLLDHLDVFWQLRLVICLILQQDVFPYKLQEVPSWPVLLACVALSNTFEPSHGLT